MMSSEMIQRLSGMGDKERIALLRKVLAVFRRAELKAVNGSDPVKRKKTSLHNPIGKSAILLDRTISYQTLPSGEDPGVNAQSAQPAEIIRQNKHGATFAVSPAMDQRRRDKGVTESDAIVPIGNLPSFDSPADDAIPNDYQFEIWRLRRRVVELECELLDRVDKIRQAIEVIDGELLYWRTGLHSHVWESLGQIQRRVVRLEAALAALKAPGSKVVPPLEIPARWKKSSTLKER